ncbi:hypothetical protein [Gordonia sp. CPCC 205333]|uniref:hypothetical protein n=1 Tax=Gordonia sp. CPCC 205333 TaxID=3140790 RepID=UPI003AF401E6
MAIQYSLLTQRAAQFNACGIESTAVSVGIGRPYPWQIVTHGGREIDLTFAAHHIGIGGRT